MIESLGDVTWEERNGGSWAWENPYDWKSRWKAAQEVRRQRDREQSQMDVGTWIVTQVNSAGFGQAYAKTRMVGTTKTG